MACRAVMLNGQPMGAVKLAFSLWPQTMVPESCPSSLTPAPSPPEMFLEPNEWRACVSRATELRAQTEFFQFISLVGTPLLEVPLTSRSYAPSPSRAGTAILSWEGQ